MLPWIVLVVALGLSSGSLSATFVVTSTLDEVDALPGDGACASASGACTLRAAVQEANALPGIDAVTLPAGRFVLTLAGAGEEFGATGDLDVWEDISVTGAGAGSTVIDAAGIDRILDAFDSLAVAGLTLTGGVAIGGAAIADRGRGTGLSAMDCVFERNRSDGGGGSVSSNSPLTIRDCIFRLNETAGEGGAIFSSEPFTISGSVFDQNRADEPSSGGWGGALALEGAAIGSIEDCTFSDNHARRFGGAIAVYAEVDVPARVILRRVTITACTTAGTGGAIMLGDNREYSTVQILDSTLTGNHADVAGGALFVEDSFEPGMGIVMVNSTVSANSAPRGGAASGGHLVALNCTVAFNDAAVGAGIDAAGVFGVTEFGRSILFGNTGGSDCEGPIVSLGHNVFGAAAPCTITGDTSTDLFAVDPLLGPLQDNGGTTFTHELLAGSPAIDAALDTCVDDAGAALVSDQRGSLRPGDGDGDTMADCDVGAFEVCGSDTDGDTLGDGCDCAAADPTTMRVPAEGDLRMAKDVATDDALVSWRDLALQAGASTRYDVASEAIGTLWTRRMADAPCVATGILGPWIDARGVTNRGWYYLVRGVNACGPPLGQGWGSDSLGGTRPACP